MAETFVFFWATFATTMGCTPLMGMLTAGYKNYKSARHLVENGTTVQNGAISNPRHWTTTRRTKNGTRTSHHYAHGIQYVAKDHLQKTWLVSYNDYRVTKVRYDELTFGCSQNNGTVRNQGVIYDPQEIRKFALEKDLEKIRHADSYGSFLCSSGGSICGLVFMFFFAAVGIGMAMFAGTMMSEDGDSSGALLPIFIGIIASVLLGVFCCGRCSPGLEGRTKSVQVTPYENQGDQPPLMPLTGGIGGGMAPIVVGVPMMAGQAQMGQAIQAAAVQPDPNEMEVTNIVTNLKLSHDPGNQAMGKAIDMAMAIDKHAMVSEYSQLKSRATPEATMLRMMNDKADTVMRARGIAPPVQGGIAPAPVQVVTHGNMTSEGPPVYS